MELIWYKYMLPVPLKCPLAVLYLGEEGRVIGNVTVAESELGLAEEADDSSGRPARFEFSADAVTEGTIQARGALQESQPILGWLVAVVAGHHERVCRAGVLGS